MHGDFISTCKRYLIAPFLLLRWAIETGMKKFSIVEILFPYQMKHNIFDFCLALEL